MFYFFFFQKAENNRFKKKKASWSKFVTLFFLFLFKIGSVGHVNKQVNLVLSYINSF